MAPRLTFEHDRSLIDRLPALTQVNLKSGRVYKIETGEHKGKILPSITNVLGKKPKPFLESWKQRVGAHEAALITARAAATGMALHALCEAYVGNQPLPTIKPHVGELWHYLRPWIDEHVTRVYAQEFDLYSDRLGAAGRTDLLADVDREIAIVDFKQSTRPKKSEYVQDYRLQGTFYALAVFERTGVPVRRVYIPVVSPEGLQVFETTPAENFGELRERIDYYYDAMAQEAA